MNCARFDINRRGRDFIFGDLHGCFDQLEAALDRRRFDSGSDRLFSVGDLIDRGPDSAAALSWLRQPWFHACLGNHEDMLLQAPADASSLRWWSQDNGGDWWLDADQELRSGLLAQCRRLPLVMEVATASGSVGMVHADCPSKMPWPAFVTDLELGSERARQIALWSRARLGRGLREEVAGVDRVVCGHTITPQCELRVLGNVWFIDTGAYLHGSLPRAHLTLLNLAELFA